MQQSFYELADYLGTRLRGNEVFLANFAGEQSDFVRFNRSLIRQAGHVTQRYLDIDLVQGQRHVGTALTLTGEPATDRQRVDVALDDLRRRLEQVPEDPYLLYSEQVCSSERCGANKLPERDAALEAILKAGQGRDLVGLYAHGGIFRGFANSLGQRNWFASYSFHLDWSFYHAADKAVKTGYAGFAWDAAAFERKVQTAARQLEMLRQPARTIKPGRYRVYLAPEALEDITSTLGWGGFSLKAHRTKSTCLLRMVEGDARMSPLVTLSENTAEGIAPNFQGAGFLKPDRVVLIDGGRYANCLVSPRSAKEYGVETNGASNRENPEALDMAAGELAQDDILPALDTGIYINQLHYLNFSDRPGGRITGMTRFATFWVEKGRIVAPLNVMRFDETAYRVLGENLLGLTRQRDFLPSTSTYGSRSTGSSRLPGALVREFNFTL